MRNFGYTEDGKVASLFDLRIWKRIYALCRPRITGFLLALVLSLVPTGATLAMPALLQMGIDRFINSQDIPIAIRLAGIEQLAIFYAIMVLLTFAAGFSQVVLLEWLGQNLMHSLRMSLFGHLLRQRMEFFQKQATGSLVTRLTNDIQNMHEMFTSVLVTLCNDLLRLTGILAVLVWMNPGLGLAMTLFLPLALLASLLFSRLVRSCFRLIRTRLARLNTFLQEAITNMDVVQIFGKEERLAAQYQALCDQYMGATFRQIRLFAIFFPLTELMSATAVAVILWYGGGQVIRQQLTLGQLVAFLSYMRLFFQPVRELSQKYSIVQSALASAERIFQLLDTDTTLAVLPPKHAVPARRGDVRIREVCFSYGPGKNKPVLRNLNCTLAPGKVTALVGPTGSGKSTLASLLVRFHDPDSGVVLLDRVDLRHYTPAALRSSVGIIMQEVFLLADTIRNNVLAGSSADTGVLARLAAETGLERVLNRMPQGWETKIGEGGTELSTGEKQLISFVRVMLRNPALLIFDEATAAIDTETENLLERAVQRAFADRTVLVIAHRLSTVRRADHILVMDQGRIVEQGSHAQLVNSQGLYESLVRLDLAGNSRLEKGNR